MEAAVAVEAVAGDDMWKTAAEGTAGQVQLKLKRGEHTLFVFYLLG